MRGGLAVIGVWSLGLLLVGLWIVWGSFEDFTLPFLVQCAGCFVLSVAGRCIGNLTSLAFWLAAPLLGLTPLAHWHARWGGTDGPGMRWYMLIAPGCTMAFFIASALILYALVVRR